MRSRRNSVKKVDSDGGGKRLSDEHCYVAVGTLPPRFFLLPLPRPGIYRTHNTLTTSCNTFAYMNSHKCHRKAVHQTLLLFI
jgi:hypothetical protein